MAQRNHARMILQKKKKKKKRSCALKPRSKNDKHIMLGMRCMGAHHLAMKKQGQRNITIYTTTA